MIRVTPQAIPDILLIEPERFGDDRGFFAETFRQSVLEEAGFDKSFVQENQAFSQARGTVRGLHFQTGAHAQSKLVRVTRGAVLDIAVDLRAGSPWYGQALTVELSADNFRQLLIPEGFAHGYVTLTQDSEALYKVTAYYEPAAEQGVLWCDAALNLDLPVTQADAVVRPRDTEWPTLDQLQTPFRYEAKP